MSPLLTYVFQYDYDLEYYSKYPGAENAGAGCEQRRRHQCRGAASKVLEARFRECYGDAQTPEEFARSIKEGGSVITRKISTELA